MPGRILNFHEDGRYKNGVVLLTDSVPETPEYIEKANNCHVFLFPLKPHKNNAKFALHILKFGMLYKIL